MYQPVQDFVHGTVAAQHQHQAGMLLHRFTGQARSIPGTRGGKRTRGDSGTLQRVNGTLENVLRIPPDFPCDRIVDQDWPLIDFNPLSITFP